MSSTGESFYEELGRRLAARSPIHLETALPGIPVSDLRRAAVLVPLAEGPRGPSLTLTRRPERMRAHAGQVAFPGGAREPTDPSDLATALREAHEELGIPPDLVQPLGALDEVFVITGFRINPWVARIPDGLELRPSAEEVARVFTCPLEELVDPRRTRVRLERVEREGVTFDIPYFEHDGEVIWGATGRVVLNLLELALGYVAPPAVPRVA